MIDCLINETDLIPRYDRRFGHGDLYVVIRNYFKCINCLINANSIYHETRRNRLEFGTTFDEKLIHILIPNIDKKIIKDVCNRYDFITYTDHRITCPTDRIIYPEMFQYLHSLNNKIIDSDLLATDTDRINDCVIKLAELQKRLCDGFDGFMNYLIRPIRAKSANKY